MTARTAIRSTEPANHSVPIPAADIVSALDADQPVDDDRQEQLVLDHLWLADVIARRFRGRGEDDEDLQQVARCALIEAAHRYDPDHGPFISFAGPTISGVLKRHFRDRGWVVRPPRQTQQLAVRITQRWSEVAQQHGTVPNDRDLAASLGEPVSLIREARQASQGYRTVPLDALSSPSAVASSDDPEYARCEARVLIHQAWRHLDPQERRLLRLRFWEQRSQSDIAEQIGTSQMQVSRLLSRVLSRLRSELAEQEGEPQGRPAPHAA